MRLGNAEDMGTGDEDLLHAAALEEFAGTKRSSAPPCIFDNRLLLQHACSCKDFSADAPGTAPRMLFQFEALLLLVSNVSRGVCLAEAAEAKAAEEFRERSGAGAEASQGGAVDGQAEAKVGRLQDDTADEIGEEEEQEGEEDNKMDELLTEEAAYPTESQVRDAFLKAYSTLLASGTASPDACVFRVPLKCIMKRPYTLCPCRGCQGHQSAVQQTQPLRQLWMTCWQSRRQRRTLTATLTRQRSRRTIWMSREMQQLLKERLQGRRISAERMSCCSICLRNSLQGSSQWEA